MPKTLNLLALPIACLQRRYSVAKIETSQTYEKGRPKLGGLSDPRLGTMDRALKCTTDGNGVLDCPGYFGHIELAKPMFHVHFLKTVVKVLRCVSYHNSKLMILPVSAVWVCGVGPVAAAGRWVWGL
jgi:DNA-directed RNA polymerase beta' subunit